MARLKGLIYLLNETKVNIKDMTRIANCMKESVEEIDNKIHLIVEKANEAEDLGLEILKSS